MFSIFIPPSASQPAPTAHCYSRPSNRQSRKFRKKKTFIALLCTTVSHSLLRIFDIFYLIFVCRVFGRAGNGGASGQSDGFSFLSNAYNQVFGGVARSKSNCQLGETFFCFVVSWRYLKLMIENLKHWKSEIYTV